VSHYRVLIPTTNPARTGPLLKAASPFLNAEDSRGTLLGVIEMAPDRPLSEGVEVARAYRTLLSRITRYAERGPGELRGQVRIIPEAGDDIEATARLTEQTGMAFQRYSNLVRALVGQEPHEPEPPMEPELLSYLIAAALNLQVGEKQALLAERRTDERLGLELRILRKEIGLLREMVAHAGSAQARASLN